MNFSYLILTLMKTEIIKMNRLMVLIFIICTKKILDFIYFLFIGTMFNTDPSLRPNINEVMNQLENIARKNSIKFMENLVFLKKTEFILHNGLNNSQASNR